MPLGDYSLEKLDFLRAGLRVNPLTGERYGVLVNRSGYRMMHPYGIRMVRDGFFTVSRRSSMGVRCTYTVLNITAEGIAELARLEKRLAKIARRHARQPFREPQRARAKHVKASNQTRAIAARAMENVRRRDLGQSLVP